MSQVSDIPEPQDHAPRLQPVFSVLVSGHRQQRLQPPELALELLAQRQQALEHLMRDLLSRLKAVATETFDRVQEVYAEVPPLTRLITGSATGADALGARLAQECGYELDYLLPRASQTAIDAPDAARGVAMQMQPQEGANDLPESEYRLRDRLALSFSDLLVAVWDGREPQHLGSGTSLMIREALLRRTPTCILLLPPDAEAPQLLWLDLQKLTDAWLTEVQVLGCTTDLLLQVFDELPLDAGVTAQRLQQWMDILLIPFRPALQPDNPELALLKRIEQQRSVSRYLLQWLFWWLLQRGWRKTPVERPLPLVEWIRGSWLWLNIMLNPPQKSQSVRLMEILHTEVRQYTRQERMISRAHGFFSGLAKLDLGSALQALIRPPCYQGYGNISADAMAGVPNPIQEPKLEQVFNWSDTQARVFATRYRDDTWLIYYAAAFAVFCAVAGAIHLWPAPSQGIPFIWVFLEFVLLHFIVRRVLQSRFRNYHGRWMSFRFIAEQVRYLRLGYPLLVLPNSYSVPVWEPVVERGRMELRLKSAEAWMLQRLLIAEGLPRCASGQPVYAMTEHNTETLQYIRAVLEEHRHYYLSSYHHLHREHTYLHRLAFGLFTLTFFAVTIHFFFTLPAILIFTAFFPAWGAAIHGILSQNEVVRVSSMAAQVWRELTTLKEAFELHEHLAGRATSWQRTQQLRELVEAASTILSNENQYWRSLFQHNHPDLPA
ncbi:hypothetical protein [Marinospirillum alkaliphilum]|uniref:SMODS and SLOG-associating 2TM effector domain-containing protein n=1 Tax=Marinospirillum alkaliphilum DSM 21637 TaxID=1122209 RepID=A0A1K1Y3I0_9GAMM|nr:hypothetical protein [Marinospirillum alkaliphilum]SFX55828.1 hypothetical protein SAMN02745752_02073 [Marinospirillum alkaliphilum DSM 21637]